MADQNTSLPVRTEADGLDERLHVKIVDGTTPAQRATVDTDGNVHVESHGNDPTGTDRVVRTSELGATAVDGIYSVTNNTDPSNIGLIAANRAASPADADQIQRLTAKTGTVDTTVHALDVSLHDENGNAFSATNPIAVTVVNSEGGISVNDYATSTAVAVGASVNHDYTVTALMTLSLTQIEASASGKMKVEIKIETGVATGSFTTKWVQFNSTSTPNTSLHIDDTISVAAGVRVRIVLTNKDNQAQDLYSTISGREN